MPVTVQELNGVDPLREAFKQEGITPGYLAKKLKAELEAKTGRKIAWQTRQRARMDAHKLMSHYPVEKKDITVHGDLGDMTDQEIDDELKDLKIKGDEKVLSSP